MLRYRDSRLDLESGAWSVYPLIVARRAQRFVGQLVPCLELLVDLGDVLFARLEERRNQVVKENIIDRGDAVGILDFFTFFKRAAVVRDGDFVCAGLRPANHGRNLNFHAEPLAGQLKGSDDWGVEGFVARLDICHVPVGEEVAEEREESIRQKVVKVEDSSSSTN